eukprot:Clim_evm99s149 gene=Clim_evmTU99s149
MTDAQKKWDRDGNCYIDLSFGVLGEGTYATVYKGYWKDGKKELAIKVLKDKQMTQQGVKDFENEARFLKALKHPNIVQCYGMAIFIQDEQRNLWNYGLVMEFLPAGCLYDRLNGEDMYVEYTHQQVDRMILDIAKALHFLHTREPKHIVHMDMKPENVLVKVEADGQYTLKLSDFGVSRMKEHTKQPLTRAARPTPYYRAPESIINDHNYTRRSDIYSVGIIWNEIYTREDPFPADKLDAFFRKIVNGAQPRLSERLTDDRKAVVMRCIDHNPENRPHADELIAAMEQIIAKGYAGLD